MLYLSLLNLHNILRWAVILVAVWALFRHLTGWLGKGGWLPADQKASKWYPIVLDIEFAIGLILYLGVSPMMRAAFADMQAAMLVPAIRFFLVEHIAAVFAAVAIAHVGKVRAMRLTDSVQRHKALFLWYLVSFLLILSRIPWNRALFPGLHG